MCGFVGFANFKKEISKDTQVAIQHISGLLSVLSAKYKTWLNEEPED